jgi:hypothetical protein
MGVGRVGEPCFQCCRAANDVLCLRRVLHTRQLDHDTVGALLLDYRFRHAEFIHAVMQRDNVLLECTVFRQLLRRRRERTDDLITVAALTRRPLQFVQAIRQRGARGIGCCLVGEVDHD